MFPFPCRSSLGTHPPGREATLGSPGGGDPELEVPRLTGSLTPAEPLHFRGLRLGFCEMRGFMEMAAEVFAWKGL